ncbi:MAG TPA: flagellar basal body-associated FliL family protein [Paracoccaceae bacterium]|nr:flagellar basal body-associated FliL family protein [Paracoccaceae bacterium]HMO72963.1 flagellar basal body-associated FliL family protein [Paracoccaceae bacterium]
MAEAAAALPDDAPPRRSRKPLFYGLLAALILGGGGFYATYSGLVFGHRSADPAQGAPTALPDIAFVPVEPVVISLGRSGGNRHLRITAQLEVARSHAAEVQLLSPRILDVLNGYLRAIDLAQIEDPAALLRIRAQLLRRIQMVTGEGRVRDLLITEFVVN